MGASAVLLTSPIAQGEAGAAIGLTAEGWMAAGWDAYRAGTLQAAERDFRVAAIQAPTWATPAVWLGAVRVARGDREGAAAWFRAALARHPTLAEAGYAEAWLERLGLGVDRQKWMVASAGGLSAFVHAANPALTASQARWVGAALREAAAREQIDVRLLAAVVYVESRFQHQIVSTAGALGLAQLMPDTAHGLGVDARDPWENLLGAARLLRENYDEFQSIPLTLAAYNAGSAAVRRWGGIPPYAETQWYVWAVQWVAQGLIASTSGPGPLH
jgi:soluble lytic murein transglycosylase-like protein